MAELDGGTSVGYQDLCIFNTLGLVDANLLVEDEACVRSEYLHRGMNQPAFHQSS
jgi:hypothetical protein